MRTTSKRLIGATLVLSVIAALAGSYALLSAYDRRLSAIEHKLSAFENSRRLIEAIADQAPSSDTSSQAARHPWPQAQRVPSRTLPRSGTSRQQDVHQRQMNRLTALETEFKREQVDNTWAARTEGDVHDVLAYAAATSGFDPIDSSVKCRSSSCKIEVDMAMAADPEDLLLQLSVEMAEMLPRSKTVALPDGKGNKRLSIYATR